MASLAAVASCSAPSKGSLVVAISTDMQTPKDLDVISVFVSTNSVPKLDFLGRVAPDGTVNLPSTLAIVEPDDPNAQVRIRVTAFQAQKARILRDVQTTVPHERTALLRVPLSFLDDGSAAGTLPSQFVPGLPGGPADGPTMFDPTDPLNVQSPTCEFTQGLTSVAGTCQKVSVDSTKLADFAPPEVFGEGGTQAKPTCFQVSQCFSKAAPVPMPMITTMTDGSCTFPLTPGESGQDWNCAVATTDGTGACSGGMCLVPLESDPGEGFTIQAGKAIVMVPGVCKKLAKGATLLVDRSSCSTKVEAAPVCEPTTKQAASTDAGASQDASTGVDTGADDGSADASRSSDAASSPGAGDGGTSLGCKADTGCPANAPFCNTALGTCAQCLTTANCMTGATCMAGTCVAAPDAAP